MNKEFSINEALKFGWQMTLKNFWFWAGLVLIMFVIRAVMGTVQGGMLRNGSNLLLGLIWLIFMLITIIVQMGMMKMALKFIDGKVPAYSDLWKDLDAQQIFFFILAAFLIGCGVAAGMVLLIIPGIYLALSWSFTSYVIVDKKAWTIDAMKESWHMADGVRWTLLGFFVVLVVVNILGAILFGIGVFWSLPTTLLAAGWVYRKLSGAIKVDEKSEVPVPEVPMVPAADIS